MSSIILGKKSFDELILEDNTSTTDVVVYNENGVVKVMDLDESNLLNAQVNNLDVSSISGLSSLSLSSLDVDTVSEHTADNGVTIESVLLKDNSVTADTISINSDLTNPFLNFLISGGNSFYFKIINEQNDLGNNVNKLFFYNDGGQLVFETWYDSVFSESVIDIQQSVLRVWKSDKSAQIFSVNPFSPGIIAGAYLNMSGNKIESVSSINVDSLVVNNSFGSDLIPSSSDAYSIGNVNNYLKHVYVSDFRVDSIYPLDFENTISADTDYYITFYGSGDGTYKKNQWLHLRTGGSPTGFAGIQLSYFDSQSTRMTMNNDYLVISTSTDSSSWSDTLYINVNSHKLIFRNFGSGANPELFSNSSGQTLDLTGDFRLPENESIILRYPSSAYGRVRMVNIDYVGMTHDTDTFGFAFHTNIGAYAKLTASLTADRTFTFPDTDITVFGTPAAQDLDMNNHQILNISNINGSTFTNTITINHTNTTISIVSDNDQHIIDSPFGLTLWYDTAYSLELLKETYTDTITVDENSESFTIKNHTIVGHGGSVSQLYRLMVGENGFYGFFDSDKDGTYNYNVFDIDYLNARFRGRIYSMTNPTYSKVYLQTFGLMGDGSVYVESTYNLYLTDKWLQSNVLQIVFDHTSFYDKKNDHHVLDVQINDHKIDNYDDAYFHSNILIDASTEYLSINQDYASGNSLKTLLESVSMYSPSVLDTPTPSGVSYGGLPVLNNVEYYDYDSSAWVAWSDSGVEKMFDTLPGDYLVVDYTHRNFRITFSNMSYRDFSWLSILRTYTTYLSNPVTINIEHSSDNSTWTALSNYPKTITDSSEIIVLPALFKGIGDDYIRVTITIDFSDSSGTMAFVHLGVHTTRGSNGDGAPRIGDITTIYSPTISPTYHYYHNAYFPFYFRKEVVVNDDQRMYFDVGRKTALYHATYGGEERLVVRSAGVDNVVEFGDYGIYLPSTAHNYSLYIATGMQIAYNTSGYLDFNHSGYISAGNQAYKKLYFDSGSNNNQFFGNYSGQTNYSYIQLNKGYIQRDDRSGGPRFYITFNTHLDSGGSSWLLDDTSLGSWLLHFQTDEVTFEYAAPNSTTFTTFFKIDTAGALHISNSNGWGEFGSLNQSWFHIETDRPSFYFNTHVTVNGDVRPYNDLSTDLGTSSLAWKNIYFQNIYARTGYGIGAENTFVHTIGDIQTSSPYNSYFVLRKKTYNDSSDLTTYNYDGITLEVANEDTSTSGNDNALIFLSEGTTNGQYGLAIAYVGDSGSASFSRTGLDLTSYTTNKAYIITLDDGTKRPHLGFARINSTVDLYDTINTYDVYPSTKDTYVIGTSTLYYKESYIYTMHYNTLDKSLLSNRKDIAIFDDVGSETYELEKQVAVLWGAINYISKRLGIKKELERAINHINELIGNDPDSFVRKGKIPVLA